MNHGRLRLIVLDMQKAGSSRDERDGWKRSQLKTKLTRLFHNPRRRWSAGETESDWKFWCDLHLRQGLACHMPYGMLGSFNSLSVGYDEFAIG